MKLITRTQKESNGGPVKVFVNKHSTTNEESGTTDEPYHSIKGGTENATNDDTVVVLDGIYKENVDIDKEITLQVKNLHGATIMGSVTIQADNVSVKGFIIDGEENLADTSGVTVPGFSGFNGSSTISGNEIKNFNQAIMLDFDDPENDEAVLIRWNYPHHNKVGIYSAASIRDAAIEITNNNIKYNDNGIHTAGTGVMVNHNNILVNDNGLINYSDSTQNAKYNWWGDEESPSTTSTESNSATTDAEFPDGSVDFSPWLCDPIEYNPENSLGGCEDEEIDEVTTSRFESPIINK